MNKNIQLYLGKAEKTLPQLKDNSVDLINCDPPYSYRKGMEKYKGHYTSRFNLIKEEIPRILNKGGIIITFGYHSTFMGKKRGFKLREICLICHGGAQHDTIAIIEEREV